MIGNNMTNDKWWDSYNFPNPNKRMSYEQNQRWQAEKKEQGCIKVEPKKGSRFDVWA